MSALTMTEAEALVGKTVRSYDFEGRKDCYMEGVVEKVGPAPVCAGSCPHLHIKVKSVVFRGIEDNERLLACPEEQRYTFPALNWCNIEEVA